MDILYFGVILVLLIYKELRTIFYCEGLKNTSFKLTIVFLLKDMEGEEERRDGQFFT